jgi:hypothetical protein
MNEPDPITATLEHVAEQADDFTEGVLERYGRAHPASAALMSHMDEHMRGRMMADVLTLLMTEPDAVDRGYLGFEVASHRAYGVDVDQFPDLLHSVRDWVRERLGPAWDDAAQQAWDARIDAHLRSIRAVAVH